MNRRSVDRALVLKTILWAGQHGHQKDCQCNGCITLWGELEAINKRDPTPTDDLSPIERNKIRGF